MDIVLRVPASNQGHLSSHRLVCCIHLILVGLPVIAFSRTFPGSSAPGSSVPFTAGQQAQIVDAHNHVRGQVTPPAADMDFMRWDDDLATAASGWARKCTMQHGLPPNSTITRIGQNIWAGLAHSKNLLHPAVSPVNAWARESRFYDYEMHACTEGRMCGHYTQIVWAGSRSVGCGRAFCPPNGIFRFSVWIVVCNYHPGGNIRGRRPYQAGRSCSRCASGNGQCYRNKCRACSDHTEHCECNLKCQNCGTLNPETCTCLCPKGWHGNECEQPCVDTHEYCGRSPGWPNRFACQFASYIPRYCPLMCGMCEKADPDYMCSEDWKDNFTTMETMTTDETITADFKTESETTGGLDAHDVATAPTGAPTTTTDHPEDENHHSQNQENEINDTLSNQEVEQKPNRAEGTINGKVNDGGKITGVEPAGDQTRPIGENITDNKSLMHPLSPSEAHGISEGRNLNSSSSSTDEPASEGATKITEASQSVTTPSIGLTTHGTTSGKAKNAVEDGEDGSEVTEVVTYLEAVTYNGSTRESPSSDLDDATTQSTKILVTQNSRHLIIPNETTTTEETLEQIKVTEFPRHTVRDMGKEGEDFSEASAHPSAKTLPESSTVEDIASGLYTDQSATIQESSLLSGASASDVTSVDNGIDTTQTPVHQNTEGTAYLTLSVNSDPVVTLDSTVDYSMNLSTTTTADALTDHSSIHQTSKNISRHVTSVSNGFQTHSTEVTTDSFGDSRPETSTEYLNSTEKPIGHQSSTFTPAPLGFYLIPSDLCRRIFTAMAFKGHTLFLFQGKHLWMIDTNRGDVISNKEQSTVHSYFGLPGQKVTAAYYRQVADEWTLFTYFHIFTIKNNTNGEGFHRRKTRRKITDLGIPFGVVVDAAFHDEWRGKSYLFTGRWVWRYDDERGDVDAGYPRQIRLEFRGLGRVHRLSSAISLEKFHYLLLGNTTSYSRVSGGAHRVQTVRTPSGGFLEDMFGCSNDTDQHEMISAK